MIFRVDDDDDKDDDDASDDGDDPVGYVDVAPPDSKHDFPPFPLQWISKLGVQSALLSDLATQCSDHIPYHVAVLHCLDNDGGSAQ